MNEIRQALKAGIAGLDFKNKWHFWWFNFRYPRATYKGLMWIKSMLEHMDETLLFDDDIEHALLKDFPRRVENEPIPEKLLKEIIPVCPFGDDCEKCGAKEEGICNGA